MSPNVLNIPIVYNINHPNIDQVIMYQMVMIVHDIRFDNWSFISGEQQSDFMSNTINNFNLPNSYTFPTRENIIQFNNGLKIEQNGGSIKRKSRNINRTRNSRNIKRKSRNSRNIKRKSRKLRGG